MQVPVNTVQLVWGLFDDRCCTAEPLHIHNSSNTYVVPENGWNPPSSQLQLAGTTAAAKQVSLGWTFALLLTEQGEAFVSHAARVLQQAR